MQKLISRNMLLAVSAICLLMSASTAAQKLLVAQVKSGEYFELNATSKEDVIGGEIRLGDKSLLIRKLSVHGLIGASEIVEDGGMVTEYGVFSSSFSLQTSVGNPWVAARQYKGCSDAYNSFLAVYSVTDEKKNKALGPIPYALLTDSLDNSDVSTVYCFNSKPPEKL